MKRITILAVGKFKEDFLSPALDEYIKRLSRFCKLNIVEIASSDMIGESDALIKHGIDFLLDINGEQVTSPDLSRLIESKYVLGQTNVTFAIGGSDGVDDRVKSHAQKRLSFGKITYPHQLMRVILLEQIYRAFTITSNMPYHK